MMSIANMMQQIAEVNGEEIIERFDWADKSTLAANKTAFTILSAEKKDTKEQGVLWFIVIQLESGDKQTMSFRPNPRRDQLLELVPKFAPIQNVMLNKVKLPSGNYFYSLEDKK